MTYKPIVRIGLIGLAFTLVFGNVALADGPEDPIKDPSHKIQITETKFGALGGVSGVPGDLTLEMSSIPPAKLARRDYQNIYNEAQKLLDVSLRFRKEELQVRVGDGYGPRLGAATLKEALLNYQNFNEGRLFYGFCDDYDRVDRQGYCPPGQPRLPGKEDFTDVRNKLIRARDLFAVLSLAEPADLTLTSSLSGTLAARPSGRAGVLAATREIANVHLIFGNEFLVDALDYRFSAGALPSGEQIIQQELNQLRLAQQQFSLAFDVLVYAFNADTGGPTGARIGDYFTEAEFELFGITSERLAVTLEEMALRYRQLSQDDRAMALYTQAFTSQYLQALALAQKASERNTEFRDAGGFELISNLGRLQAQAQAIRNGFNPFGYQSSYVPLQTYTELHDRTEKEFLRDATEDENAARDSQREFDQNATKLRDELQNLRVTYGNQLLELCGQSKDDYKTCQGGLMKQNFDEVDQAYTRIREVDQRIKNNLDSIRIEWERAGQVINLILENGQQIALWDYVTTLNSSYSENEGTSASFGVSESINVSESVGLLGPSISVGFSYGWSVSYGTSEGKAWNPYAPEIAHLTQLKSLRQSAERAKIEGANSEAVIRNKLLEQAELYIQRDLAIQEFNQRLDEHNHQAERYRNLLDLRAQAEQNVLDSYLNNPAYRILREQQTIEAGRSHSLAAQFAYLTAKALEYEFLQPIPFMSDVFEARTADDLDNFLVRLEQHRLALSNPGALNRFPYRISLAKDILGLSDENLDPNGVLTPNQRAQLRFQEFQAFLRQHLGSKELSFQFTTSIADNQIFSPNIWNNRIAGVGLPADVPGTQGAAINLITRQFGDLGTPELSLTHGGQAAYRTIRGEIVEYTPDNARVVGYPVGPGLNIREKTAVILASVNGNGKGTPTSALFNQSVAASSWTLRLDRTSPQNRYLDLSQLEDIEILMDTTGIALPGQKPSATQDSERLINEFKPTQHNEAEPTP
jgi:hypothetical protein